jgi:stage V sporulation protein G
MNITNVRVFLVPEERVKAFISITIDNCFVVNDMKLISKDDRMFVAMPSKKDGQGRYRNIAFPINTEARVKLEEIVIAEYNKVLEKTN